MPCVVDTSYEDAQRAEAAKAELNLVTRLLCEVCRTGQVSTEAKRWYAKHRAADERREAKEREDAEARRAADRERSERRIAAARDELAQAEAEHRRLGRER